MTAPLARLNLFKGFLGRIDDGTVFAGDGRAVRGEVRESLIDLLLYHRPFLEEQTGLAWPYRELARRLPTLEAEARQGKTVFLRQQASLFLALLPFSGQWRWLMQVAGEMGEYPEIRDFLSLERQKHDDKIHQKPQRGFKLHNFCQILKRPDLPGEKGILRIFSLPYLFAERDLLRRLNRFYILYIEPPWGVLARHAWLRVFSQMDDPAIIGVCGPEDADFLAGQRGIVTTRLAHGDFLEEQPVPPACAKEFDLVFNASFDEMDRKRHGFMLDLLARPPLDRVTALFIGRGSAANVATFRTWVNERGLGDRVVMLANLRRNEVPEQLSRCRIGVFTSLNENGCRGIYECFRADLPCVVTSSMAGCNFELIDGRNGLVASDAGLPGAILSALRHPENFSPRAWFLHHSGSRLSSLRLNGEMKNLFSRLGYAWREDIVPLGSSGATRYVDEAHHASFRAEFEQLLEILKPFVPVRLSL